MKKTLTVTVTIEIDGNETKEELSDAIAEGIAQSIRDEAERSRQTTQIWELLESKL